MKEQWAEQLKQKMADYQRPAPEVSWDEVDKVLPANTHRFVWLRRIAAAAAVVLLVGGAGYWFLIPRSQSLVQGSQSLVQSSRFKLQGQWMPSHEAQPPVAMEQAIPINRHTSPVVLQTTDTASYLLAATSTDVQDTVSTYEPVAKNAPTTIADNQKLHAPGRHRVIYPSVLPQRKKSESRLMAKLYVSNAMMDDRLANMYSRQVTEYTYEPHSDVSIPTGNDYGKDGKDGIDGKDGKDGKGAVDPDDSNPDDPNGGETVSEGALRRDASSSTIVWDTIATVRTIHANEQVHHHQPVRYGLSLRYRLDDRWSLETGLSYTLLVSDITMQEEGLKISRQQRLSYIGIPLNVGCQLWKNRYFGIYLTGGCMVEKMLDGCPWQFSLNGALGVDYHLSERVSLYGEPGLGYYFNNGSSIPTIYKDRPLNFNLCFGFRIDL